MNNAITYSECCNEKIVSTFMTDASSTEALLCTKCGRTFKKQKNSYIRPFSGGAGAGNHHQEQRL